MKNDAALQDVLADLADYLEFRLEQGDRTEELFSTAHAVKPTPVPKPITLPEPEPVAEPAPLPEAAPAAEGARATEQLERIAGEVGSCEKCSLSRARTRVVPGQGAGNPEIMFVGEAPGYEEDQQGLAFVGKAGQLLTKMIEAMGYEREEVFIGNILKCRPPDNRQPLPDEMEACLPYLREQIRVLKPKVIIALGAVAVKGLLGLSGITRLRGKWLSFEGIDLMPTYHPSYLLRVPSAKKDVWEDLKTVLALLGREVPGRKS